MARRTATEQHLAARDKLRQEPDMSIIWTPETDAHRGDNRHCGLSEASAEAGFANPRTHYRFTTQRWEWSGTKDGRRYYGVLDDRDVKVLMAFDRTGRKPKLPHVFKLIDVRSEVPAFERRSKESRQRQSDYERDRRTGKRSVDPYEGKAAKHEFGRFTVLG